MIAFSHRPVLLEECMQGLAPRSGGIYFDGTVGGGGHSYEILRRSAPDGQLIATDLDDAAIAAADKRLSEFAGRYRIFKSNYKDFAAVLDGAGVGALDGVMLDFGVSSYQLDEGERGFSFRKDAPLDMRMDQSAPLDARAVVNEYSEARLAEILRDYGEERFAKRIAAGIAAARSKKPIESTGELAAIIEANIPAKFRHSGPPATKSFQAIRIEVNKELDGLAQAVRGLALRLRKGGRICILTFHSLEDRIVKTVMRDLATDCICDKSLPVCVCGRKKELEIITRKPIVASADEQEANPRSKSAKLRIAERVTEYN